MSGRDDVWPTAASIKALRDELRITNRVLTNVRDELLNCELRAHAVHQALGFPIAPVGVTLREIHEQTLERIRAWQKELAGQSARLAASRTERDKLHGDKVRMLASIDGALASLRPWGETRSGRFPLANATVIAVHEFTESSETPGACALCGWPWRSQVHLPPDDVVVPVLEDAEYERQALLDKAELKHAEPVTAQDLEERDTDEQAAIDNEESDDGYPI